MRSPSCARVATFSPNCSVATDTVSSMQAGILYGAVDALEGMVRRLQEGLKDREKKQPKVIATGGFSKLMSDHSPTIEACEPTLVLDGVRLICERVRRSRD